MAAGEVAIRRHEHFHHLHTKESLYQSPWMTSYLVFGLSFQIGDSGGAFTFPTFISANSSGGINEHAAAFEFKEYGKHNTSSGSKGLNTDTWFWIPK